MDIFMWFACFLVYIFSIVRIGELLINFSMAVFVTGLFAWIFGVPLFLLVFFSGVS